MAEPATLPRQASFDGMEFPLLLQCRSPDADLPATLSWVAVNLGKIKEQLARHACILFRGFPFRTVEDFDAFVVAFGFEPFTYERSLSNAVRLSRTRRVFTANESPPAFQIPLHHEMAQTPLYPARIFFYCEKPAAHGGATAVCRSDILLSRLEHRHPRFVADCRAKGLRYTNIMPAENDPASGMGRSWRSTFGVTSPDAAEEKLRQLGYMWEWLENQSLRTTTPVLQAVWRDPGTGRESFFNQLIAASTGWRDRRNDPAKAVTFGDGSPLDVNAVHDAAALAEELTADLPWQAGDAALLDNMVAMHGRRPFEGQRRVFAALGDPRGPAAVC
ncbi:MAG: TauD/TfdA family dioxygenase [Planctomycetes bacterium]|nr:TauD/TfdA family dioxygenase [Planctomycetota bacterium]